MLKQLFGGAVRSAAGVTEAAVGTAGWLLGRAANITAGIAKVGVFGFNAATGAASAALGVPGLGMAARLPGRARHLKWLVPGLALAAAPVAFGGIAGNSIAQGLVSGGYDMTGPGVRYGRDPTTATPYGLHTMEFGQKRTYLDPYANGQLALALHNMR